MTIDKKDIIRVAIGLGVGLVIALLYFAFNPNVKFVDKPVIGIKTVEIPIDKIKLDTVTMVKKIRQTDTLKEIDTLVVRKLTREIDSLQVCLDKHNANITLSLDTIVKEDTIHSVVNVTKARYELLEISRKPIKTQTEIQYVPTIVPIKWYEKKELWGGLGLIIGCVIGMKL